MEEGLAKERVTPTPYAYCWGKTGEHHNNAKSTRNTQHTCPPLGSLSPRMVKFRLIPL